MSDYQSDFLDFEGKIWLNAASEGPLPKVSSQKLEEAVRWKSRPYELTLEKFSSVPKELKRSVARLINVSLQDVILGNSASYGLHLLANGLPWSGGDEIIVMENDFPTNILPWLELEKRGVHVRQVKPRGMVLTPEELSAVVTSKTRLFCISHVHTFSGGVLDVDGFAKICKKHGIICAVNPAQSLGNMPVDVSAWDVDAVVAPGYKWLLGPYGTGFAWFRRELRQRLELNHSYWPALLTDAQLQKDGPIELNYVKTARWLDQFGTANFFNFVPLKASIDYILMCGLENIWEHNQRLIDQILDGLDTDQFKVISPTSGPTRSNLVVLSHHDRSRNAEIFKRLVDQGIYPAFWKGNIRFSPHLYNSSSQISSLLNSLSYV